MKQNIIGRDKEVAQLRTAIELDKAELIAVYGRRRIGKTYLVKEFFNGNFDFYATGIFEGKKEDELKAFCDMLKQKSTKPLPKIKTWMDAFIHGIARLSAKVAKEAHYCLFG